MPVKLAVITSPNPRETDIYLTGFDKLGIAAEALSQDEDARQKIHEKAAGMKHSPLMMSYLRRKAALIASQTSEQGRDREITIFLEEMLCAQEASVSWCTTHIAKNPFSAI